MTIAGTYSLPVQPRYLFASDFDGTLFNTFYPSPNGISVQKAYQLAIKDIFGDWGEGLYRGFIFNGQTPTEIIEWFMHIFRPNEEETFDEEIKRFFNIGLTSFITAKKQGSIPLINKLEWDDQNPTKTLTELLVLKKLSCLLSEIGPDSKGTIWPPPCKGALPFLRVISDLKKEGYPVDLAVISSGHETFIKKTLEAYSLPYPQILVTEDDIRPRKYPKQEYDINRQSTRRFKPGVFPFALAHRQWLLQQGCDFRDDQIVKKALESRNYIAYFGDDIMKDYLMGLHSKVATFITPLLCDLEVVTANINNNSHMIREGAPIWDIIGIHNTSVEGVSKIRKGEIL